MRRVPLTPLGWSLLLLLVLASAGAVAGVGAVGWAAAVVFLVLLLGALAPVSARDLQTRARLRPPDVPWMNPDARRRASRHRGHSED